MNENKFTAIFLQLAELFEPPAHSPTFAKALFRALNTKLADDELPDVTEAVIESFVPTFHCPFPMVKHFMDAREKVRQKACQEVYNADLEERLRAEADQAHRQWMTMIHRLPEAKQAEIRAKAEQRVTADLRGTRPISDLAPTVREAMIESHAVRIYRQEYRATQNVIEDSPEKSLEDKAPQRHDDFRSSEGYGG